MKDILLVGAGGFIGSAMRYMVSLLMLPFGAGSVIPWGTFTVNVAGSLLIGLLISTSIPQMWQFFLIVGFCGGFTTFSTFSLEVLNTFKSGNIAAALIYIAISVVLAITATAAGYFTGAKLR